MYPGRPTTRPFSRQRRGYGRARFARRGCAQHGRPCTGTSISPGIASQRRDIEWQDARSQLQLLCSLLLRARHRSVRIPTQTHRTLTLVQQAHRGHCRRRGRNVRPNPLHQTRCRVPRIEVSHRMVDTMETRPSSTFVASCGFRYSSISLPRSFSTSTTWTT